MTAMSKPAADGTFESCLTPTAKYTLPKKDRRSSKVRAPPCSLFQTRGEVSALALAYSRTARDGSSAAL
jgi:hypothetical protein